MKRYLLDTNVLLRFLLADHPRLTPKARRLFERAQAGECRLVLTDVALAEAVWVLESHYRVGRKAITETLGSLIGKPGVACPHQAVLTDALQRYGEKKCDFYDCYLAAMAADSGDAVASFDRDLRKFDDVELWDGT
ncbi:tRNA(fMet)-specific endonuclease VapC [Pseudobythopirellula maris]|uniref:Ribonuclease VapC n=1 Tax=Pseudobythopirellula maris TaxID=2527991 RepID=A0A5C5ZPP5_9BACT|nr:type II toxin-antitoxin system VapC family toxin [Pseudobythopirellula maris]TWT88877.1 tRNA(fMet)-specific endonuclease VapC [Pseudobythopirellula maris]